MQFCETSFALRCGDVACRQGGRRQAAVVPSCLLAMFSWDPGDTSQCVDSSTTQQDSDLNAHSSTPSTSTSGQLTPRRLCAIRQSDVKKAANIVLLDLEFAALADPIAVT